MAAVALSVPLVVFALVGFPHVFRTPLVRNVMARGSTGAPPALDAPGFTSAFAPVTGTPLTGGNHVEVLSNGEETYARLWQDLRTTLHAKTFVADGLWTTIGTANFDNRSLPYNTDVVLTVLDDTVGATMDSLFLADLRYAGEIRLAAFRRRSWWTHLRERGASVLADLL